MPVNITQTVLNGTPVRSMVEIACEGPRCTFGKDGTPQFLSWDEIQSKGDPDAVPDSAFRLLVLSSFTGGKAVFCSARCLADFMLDKYVAPLSPREQAAQDAANAAIEARKQKDAAAASDRPITEAVAAPADATAAPSPESEPPAGEPAAMQEGS